MIKTSVMMVGMNISAENGVVCLAGSGNNGHDQHPATSHLNPPSDVLDTIVVNMASMEELP